MKTGRDRTMKRAGLSQRRRCLLTLFSLFLCLFSVLTPIRGQTLSLTYTLGFNGFFKLNHWAPLTVTVENRAKGFQGLLEVETAGGSEYRRDVRRRFYSVTVDLPRGAKKVFPFILFLESYTHPLKIRLKEGEKVVLGVSINLREHFVEKPLFLFAGNKPSTPIRLFLEEVHTVFAPTTALPRAWYGYLSLKALALETLALKDLTLLQTRALQRWIESGGFLIVMGTSLTDTGIPKDWEAFLPLTQEGFTYRKGLPALERFLGFPLSLDQPVLLQRVSVPDGRVLLQEGDLPLLLEKRKGLGKILILTFHPNEAPFRKESGRNALWHKVLGLAPKTDDSNLPIQAENIFSLLPFHLSLRFPPFFPILILVLLYITAVTLLLKRLLTHRDRGKPMLLILTGLVVGVSLASWLLGASLSFPQEELGNGFLIIHQGVEKGPARWTLHWGVYSRKDQNLRFPLDRQTLVNPFFPGDSPEVIRFQDHTLEEQAEGFFLRFSPKRWTRRFFTFTFFAPPFLQGQATPDREGLLLHLIHRAATPLRDCRLYFRGQGLFLNDLHPQTIFSGKWLMDPKQSPDEARWPSATHPRNDPFPSSLRKEVEEVISRHLWQAVHEGNRARRDRAILLGWLDSLITPGKDGPPLPVRKGAGLVLWEIPIRENDPPSFSDERPKGK